MTNKEEVITLIDENSNQIEQLLNQKIDIWLEHVLFTGFWWLGVALSIVPWLIWFIFRNNQSTDRLLYVGFFVMVTALILDVLGSQFGLWHYRYNVIPIVPSFLPWDIALMPVTIMFFLQIKPNINPLMKAVLFALVASYIAEPFFTWLEIYQPKTWRYSYSVPIQIIIYLIAHFISRRNCFSKLD
ncbi:CBO0543 family protein [Halalkalibacter alkaliphilus]|uniref:Uncharacterized protein n=1 Tax=Halalkalibacter alkaliphilus TaxID=2917993 RepID=A0A9X2CSV7_9BACI|nr:CBO0543 family protein [Halalkalibacter alkaliphilus]MCL7747616.1 hypothetical protein [Halalkalibacter alkaliphilus]